MKLFSKKPSKLFMIIMAAIICPIVIAFLILFAIRIAGSVEDKKYNNKDFQSYEERYRYCGTFWGGADDSREEIYKKWEDNEVIGC